MEQLLERRRSRLERVPGVVGSGIGLARGRPDAVVVHVFVDSPERESAVRREIGPLLEGQPFEVIATGYPEAQEPTGGGRNDATT